MISDAADAVVKVLKARMPPLLKPEQIGLCTPDSTDKYALGVFAYAITRDPKAQMNGRIRVDASASVKAPLVAEVRLAITSYAGKKSGLADDYKLLERVMQLWHDYGELPVKNALQPSLVAAPRMRLLDLDADEISKIWQFPGTSYTLSLFYSLSPVAIPSHIRTTAAAVSSIDYTGDENE